MWRAGYLFWAFKLNTVTAFHIIAWSGPLTNPDAGNTKFLQARL